MIGVTTGPARPYLSSPAWIAAVESPQAVAAFRFFMRRALPSPERLRKRQIGECISFSGAAAQQDLGGDRLQAHLGARVLDQHLDFGEYGGEVMCYKRKRSAAALRCVERLPRKKSKPADVSENRRRKERP